MNYHKVELDAAYRKIKEIEQERNEALESVRHLDAVYVQQIKVGDDLAAQRDRLLKEIEEQARLHGMGASREAKFMAEKDSLAAEVDRAWQTHNEHLNGPYTALQKETHALRAELEKCRTQLGDLHMEHGALRAEVERLKKVLREIKEANVIHVLDWPMRASDAIDLIVDAALDAKEGT